MMVLIVEDEVDLAQTCERLLRRQGYAVVTTGTRAAALSMLATGVSRLVVCDVGLPDGSGLDVVRAAKQRIPPVPAIVMTARPSAAGRRAALESGADAYMIKPFTASGFAALVCRTVARP